MDQINHWYNKGLITTKEKKKFVLKLQAECPHDNTIDVGDEDHILVICTNCGK